MRRDGARRLRQNRPRHFRRLLRPRVSLAGGSAPQDADKLARELASSVEELKALPDGANMGLSCGNPAALAALKPGEVVLDLGSGGGFDVFIAGRKVGATGRAIAWT